jgi:hypothetical protein
MKNIPATIWVLLGIFFLSPPFIQAVAQQSNASITSKLNITTATVVKPASGILVCFAVTVAGAAGTINDTTTTGGAAAANVIAAIPAVVGYYCGQFPFLSGLVVSPGAAQVVSVSYQ